MTRPAAAGVLLLAGLGPAAAAPPPVTVPRLDSHGHPLPPGAVARLGDYARRYGYVHEVSFSPDGKLVARSRSIGTDIRDAATGRDVTPPFVRRLRGAVRFTPAGDLLQDDDTFTYRLLDATTGDVRLELTVGNYALTNFQFLAGGEGVTAVLGPPANGGLYHFPADQGLRPKGRAIAPGWVGNSNAYCPGGRYVVVGTSGGVQVYDPAVGRPLYEHPIADGNTTGYRGLLALPDGQTVLVGRAADVVALALGPKRATEGATYKLGGALTLRPGPTADTVDAWLNDGRHVRFDRATGKTTVLYRPAGNPDELWTWALDPAGKRAALPRYSAAHPRIVDAATGATIFRYAGYLPVTGVHPTADGRAVIHGADEVREYVVATGELVAVRPLPPSHPGGWRLASPAGRLLATGSGGRVTVRELDTDRELWGRETGPDTSVRFADDRTILVHRPTGIERYDARTGDRRGDLPAGAGPVAVSADGRLVATVGAMPVRVVEASTGRVRQSIHTPRYPGNGSATVERLRFSRDGRLLAGFGSNLGAVVWSVADGTPRYIGADAVMEHANEVGDLSPDGRWLAQSQGHRVRVRDWAAGVAARDVWLDGHQANVIDVAFTPDGRHLISLGWDALALVWDVSAFAGRSRVPVRRATADNLWADLGDGDAEAAGRAVAALVGRPAEAVAVAGRELRPAVAPDPARVARLVAELAADDNPTRDRAERELAALADLAAAALTPAARSDAPERRRRAERLLARLADPVRGPDRLRVVRGVEVVERVGTADARKLLGEWAAGAPPALLTREAKAAADRLAGR